MLSAIAALDGNAQSAQSGMSELELTGGEIQGLGIVRDDDSYLDSIRNANRTRVSGRSGPRKPFGPQWPIP
jgi:hypothetical protein